jgi:hypothetical protein
MMAKESANWWPKLQPGSIGMGIGGMRQRIWEFNGELRVERQSTSLVEVIIPSRSLASIDSRVPV